MHRSLLDSILLGLIVLTFALSTTPVSAKDEPETACGYASAGKPKIPATDLKYFADFKKKCDAKQLDPASVAKWQVADWRKFRACTVVGSEWTPREYAAAYANGEGVKRNLQLALDLVCDSNPGAIAEVQSMAEELVKRSKMDAAALAKQEPFDFCNHVTSGVGGSYCAYPDAEVAKLKQQVAWFHVSGKLPKASQDKLAALRAAAAVFFSARCDGEIDLTGTLRGVFYMEEMDSLQADLLKTVQEQVQKAKPSLPDYKSADQALNEEYQRLMAGTDPDWGNVNKKSLREAQRAWLKYRDAWADFGVSLFPKTSGAGWQAMATAKRTKQLVDLRGFFDVE